MNRMRESIAKLFCVWFGHSDILHGFFGYMSCGRCGEQVGDSLGGAYTNSRAVIVGHDCEHCRANYKRLTWKDKFMAPDPKVNQS